VKWLDAVVLLAFVAVDELRNAVFYFLARADEVTLLALLALAIVLYKSQTKIEPAIGQAFDLKWLKSLKI